MIEPESIPPERYELTGTDRYFWGVRVSDELIEETLQYFLSKKAAIYELWENFEPLDDKHRLEALDFIDTFFAIIEDPEKTQAEIKKRMQSIASLDKSIARKIEKAKLEAGAAK